jgi:hypothetical protein
VTVLWRITLVRTDGTWRVDSLAIDEEWEGIVECDGV